MIINTLNFGEIEVSESQIINFDDGLPGFSEVFKWVVLPVEGEGLEDFYCLQAINEPNLSLFMITVDKIMPNYNPLVDEHFLDSTGIDVNNIVLYNIITIHKNLKDTTVNLRAPLVIDYINQKGKQVICLNEEYSVRYPLIQAKEAEKC